MALIYVGQDAGDPDSKQGEHADLDDTDDQHATSNNSNAPPAHLQANAEQQQDQPKFRQQPDSVEIANERGRQREWSNQHSGY